MASRNKPGTCLLCRAVVRKIAVLRHTEACLQSSGWPTGLVPSFIIRIDDRQNPSYWLTVLARHGALFSDLDHLLCDVWMESGIAPRAFSIGTETYHDTGTCMDIPLVNLLNPKSLFYYEYGFAAKTSLRLKVLGTTTVMPSEGTLCLIARNEPLFPECSVCGADAEYVASETGDDETAEYYCLKCLMDLDEAFVQLIENSPRKSVCATLENLNETIKWYPPGWEIPDLVSPEKLAFMTASEMNNEDNEEEWPEDWLVDNDEVTKMITAVSADIGEDISGFLDEEMATYGEDAAALAGEIVMGFCTLLYGLHKKTCDDWDAPLVRMCLLDEFVQSPTITDEWQEHTIPILCRFLTRMGKNGRIKNAAELTRELQETEPVFQEIIMNPGDVQDFSNTLTEWAMPNTADEDAFHAICREIVRELPLMDTKDSSSKDSVAILEDIFGVSLDTLREDMICYQMIAERCEDFCTRLENEDITERCKEMVINLSAHPDEPLSRGDGLLWSAAIVYAACREEKIIGKAKGGSPLAREICDYFNMELSSVRSKVTVLRKRLAECPDEEFPFSV